MGIKRRKYAKRAFLILALALLPDLTHNSARADQYSFTSMVFTTCGASGANGPTLANCLSQGNYSSQPWTSNTSYFNVSAGIQYWTVPVTGNYIITAAGAQGGSTSTNAGGKGVVETSTVTLTEGQIIRILVGQRGNSANNIHGSGGGGTFVIQSPYDTNTAIIMIAGGGGGYGASGGGVYMQGQTARNPTSASNNAGSNGGGGSGAGNSTPGGNGFVAGVTTTGSTWAAGGAGFGGNGGGYNGGTILGPRSFINGGTGGAGTSTNGAGGFGGGGGVGDRGGGGGGYSGGGGGNQNTTGGDGGGSYITGTNQQAVGGANSGDGYVKITLNSFPAVVSISVPVNAAYRSTIALTLNSDSPGKATFFVNGKRIPGCISISLTGSASSYSVQCNWKPATKGAANISAIQYPSNGNSVTSSGLMSISISRRTGNR